MDQNLIKFNNFFVYLHLVNGNKSQYKNNDQFYFTVDLVRFSNVGDFMQFSGRPVVGWDPSYIPSLVFFRHIYSDLFFYDFWKCYCEEETSLRDWCSSETGIATSHQSKAKFPLIFENDYSPEKCCSQMERNNWGIGNANREVHWTWTHFCVISLFLNQSHWVCVAKGR